MLPALRRCNVTDLRSGLEGIASILVEARLYLDALPVISLWEHLTLHVMRNLKATVLCRCVCVCVYCVCVCVDVCVDVPVISLWEHLTLHVMRDLKATVLCRCVCVCRCVCANVPVISLWEHLTLHVMLDLKATVLCRCVCLCVYMPMCVLMCLPSACEINSPCACVVQPSGGGVSLSSMTMLISHRSRLCLSLFNYA